MANKGLFATLAGKLAPKANAINSHAAPAYELTPKHVFAQYAATGCLNGTFYASAEDQLATVLELAQKVDPKFVAKVALYARGRGYMKDMPALLCAVLSVLEPKLLAAIFPRVIDSPKMLRNFVQIMRSGVVGRKSLGSLPKKLVSEWIASRTDEQLFTGSVGNDPSLADVIKMVHPKPQTKSREALFGWLIGREHDASALPEIVQAFEAFKAALAAGKPAEVPDVPFQMLTALPLGKKEWTSIALRAPWTATRMNLATFARHDVFDNGSAVKTVASRLADRELIKKAKAFPYQLMVAYKTAGEQIPGVIREALQDAMEVACENVPRIDGQVHVFVDVSGSMHTPVTGHRAGATTAVRCVDVAALIAAAIVRKNPSAEVLPFADSAYEHFRFNPRDAVLTNASKLAGLPSGGTNCSAPLAVLNGRKAKGDVVIYVSDYESWVDAKHFGYAGQAPTPTMAEWMRFSARNPGAKLVCIDLVPNRTVQATERNDVLNVGGFSDAVFDVISRFADGTLSPDHWVGVIEAETV